MAINFGGNVYDDAGNAVSGASVKLLETGTTTQEGSTVTSDSDGRWDFSEADQDRYDVEITKGSSVRRIKWSDEISLQEIDVRNNAAAGTPAATFTNLTNSAANQVAVFSGANSTRADNDEIYLSFKFANSAGDIEEFARMTAVATDVTDGSEDGQFEFDVLQGGSLIKAFTIASSTAGAQSIDFNQDSITFGTGTAATDITLTFDAESADGVITWMEDEDYFKFSDDILMNSTEKIQFYDTGLYIYSSTDGQLDIVADTEVQIAATTIDINGAVALNGAITGATTIDATTDFTVGSTVITDDVITFTPSSSDTVTMTSATNGAFSLVTVDAAAAAANIQITADGTVDIDSAGVLTLDSGAAINIEPASGSAILLDGTISIDAGVVTGATSITSTAFVGDITGDVTGTADVATVATTVTITDNESTNEDNAIIFTAGGDVDGGNIGLESDGTLTYNPSTGRVTATQLAGTLVTAAQTGITSVGTIGTGVWQGTAIASGYIAADAITGAKIADDAVDSEHYTDGSIDNAHIADDAIDSEHYAAGSIDTAHIADNQVTLAKMAGLARGKIIYGDASGDPAALAVGSADYVLTSNGTDVAWAAGAGAVTAINNATANELVTIGATTTELEAEGNLTFDGNVLYVGDTANGNMTAGLTINQNGADNSIFALKSSDVAHGGVSFTTSGVEADTFVNIEKKSVEGGIDVDIVNNDSGNGEALAIAGITRTANTDKDASARGAVTFFHATHDGSGNLGNVGADANAFAVVARVGGSNLCRLLSDEDGDLYSTTSAQTFDAHDDIALVDALDSVRSDAYQAASEEWQSFLREKEKELIALKVLGAPVIGVPAEKQGMTNVTQLQRLHNGAIRQMNSYVQTLESRLAVTEEKLLALQGA